VQGIDPAVHLSEDSQLRRLSLEASQALSAQVCLLDGSALITPACFAHSQTHHIGCSQILPSSHICFGTQDMLSQSCQLLLLSQLHFHIQQQQLLSSQAIIEKQQQLLQQEHKMEQQQQRLEQHQLEQQQLAEKQRQLTQQQQQLEQQ